MLRAVFRLAVADRAIARSPCESLKEVKRDTPIRDSPSWEEFLQIVADIRSQRCAANQDDSGDFIEFLGLAGLGPLCLQNAAFKSHKELYAWGGGICGSQEELR